MNVVLVSQCDKRALTQTRRILDQFAERRGDRTWQTPITEAGLDTLRKLLRKSARKNTAVACHWIRGRDHSELLWIVGDASRFNAEGAVPTDTTTRNVLRAQDENDWHSLSAIGILAALAALLHDLGKACLAFQLRLTLPTFERNEYRHEWISLRLFQAFVGEAKDDETWLKRLIAPSVQDDASWLAAGRLWRDGLDPDAHDHPPLAALPPLARAIGWLVLTHHRLPVMPSRENGNYKKLGTKVAEFHPRQLQRLIESIHCDWNETPVGIDQAACVGYWSFPYGLPVTTALWRKRAARLGQRLWEIRERPDFRDALGDPFVMHVARMSLMLADHHYSRLIELTDRVQGENDYRLYANTERKSGKLCQPLDEHLLGVEKHVGNIVNALPAFERHLARLVRHRGLSKRSADARFRWQDKAADVAAAMRARAARNGAFIVNMASTGCGKTLANARIMNALADPDVGMRCAFAMGLRTLTLQTGRAFQQLLSLADDALAIRVGGAANRELFEFYEREAERSGSASRQDLLDENAHVLYEGDDAHPILRCLGDDGRVRALLAAPILVCTIDHLTPATESQRGGRQIAPMLRLMTGDLVLDEPDDFDIADLPALTRLVHWAGLLGARVLLSSATLPPALVEGLFLAYRDGRMWFQRNRGERPGEAAPVCCAWFDEFAQAQQDCADAETFRAGHVDFARNRHAQLGRQTIRRRADLLSWGSAGQRSEDIHHAFAAGIRDAALSLHAQHHGIDPRSGASVSFGLVRMANVDPLIDVALALYALGMPAGFRLHLCVYHSRFPLLIRSRIEKMLDRVLDRRTADAVFDLREVRERIDRHPSDGHLFVVLGSPVTEVGRDHDYDWAVVEPSSMRSLIQLAGRVRRHRVGAVEQANVLVFEHNVRSVETPGEPAFRWPGFETKAPEFSLASHSLRDLLAVEDYAVIDARPRLLEPCEFRPTTRLVDLEHARLRAQMLPAQPAPAPTQRQLRLGIVPVAPSINAATWWTEPHAMLAAVIQQQQAFRDDSGLPEVELVLLPNEDEDDYALHRIDPGDRRGTTVYALVEDNQNHRIPDERVRGEGMAPWGVIDYWQALVEHAFSEDISLRYCAERYGTVRVPQNTQGWCFHPALGFRKKK